MSRAVVDRCHERERAFVLDESDRVVACCGSRAAKSDGDASRLVRAISKHPDNIAVYITLTRARSSEICGLALRRIEAQLQIGLREITVEGAIYWTYPGAGRIWLTGCADKSECEKFRGSPYSEAIIDEADSMRPYLEYLALECIEPRLLDLNGTLGLTGTPGPTLAGYFHAASTGLAQGWSRHNWTALDNPFLPNARAWIERKKLEMPHARFAREMLGIWERDPESMIFKTNQSLNFLDTSRLQTHEPGWTTVMSVDVGFNHPTAWTIWKYQRDYPTLYICYSRKQSGMTPTQAGAETKRLALNYRPSRLIVDTGGIGKGYAEEWAERYQLNFEPAQKRGRGQRLATFAGEVQSGQIKIDPVEAKELLDEWDVLTWNSTHDDIEDGLPDDCTDSALYGFSAINPSGAATQYDDGVRPDPLELEAIRRKDEARKRVAQKQRNWMG